jgi:hypothetical protein
MQCHILPTQQKKREHLQIHTSTPDNNPNTNELFTKGNNVQIKFELFQLFPP